MVRDIDIAELKTAAYNPRIQLAPGMPEWDKLYRSIKEFGNAEPIVWNERTGNVVGGHQRLAVLKDMGYTEVPCSVVDMDEEEEKLLNVALNKIKGQWDYDKLEDLLKEFEFVDASISGFSEDELAILLSDSSDIDIDNALEDFDVETSQEGAAYSVALVFEDGDKALEWAESNGIDLKIVKGSKTTVCFIKE